MARQVLPLSSLSIVSSAYFPGRESSHRFSPMRVQGSLFLLPHTPSVLVFVFVRKAWCKVPSTTVSIWLVQACLEAIRRKHGSHCTIVLSHNSSSIRNSRSSQTVLQHHARSAHHFLVP